MRAANKVLPERPSDLTLQEQAHVRTALRFLRIRCGGMKQLAKALRCEHRTLENVLGGRAVSASIAFRAARLAHVGVDELLGGKYPPPDTCPHCGRSGPAATS